MRLGLPPGGALREESKNGCEGDYQSNYMAAAARSVKNFDRKRLTSHKQSLPPKSVVHFILGLNISVIKISWVI